MHKSCPQASSTPCKCLQTIHVLQITYYNKNMQGIQTDFNDRMKTNYVPGNSFALGLGIFAMNENTPTNRTHFVERIEIIFCNYRSPENPD